MRIYFTAMNTYTQRLSFRFQGKYAEADPLFLRVIKIGEKALGLNHPNLATWLNNRAELLESQVRTVGKFEEIPF